MFENSVNTDKFVGLTPFDIAAAARCTRNSALAGDTSG